MYYGEIKKCDIANGPGVRVSLFVSGCTHHCKGCFNEETWSFEFGQPFTAETEEQILKLLEPSYISGLTVLGGEPMEYMNQEALLPFLEKVKECFPEKTIWCFTGYVFEKDILNRMLPKWKYTKKMLEQIDYLVDGPFVEAKKDITLRFRGSSNQRIIDVKKSLETGEVVLWEEQQSTLRQQRRIQETLGYSKLYMGCPRASFLAVSNLQIKFIHVYVWELFLVQGPLL